MTMATITILGRLGKDPEVRATPQGKSVAILSIAVDDGFGENKHTTWFRCQAWEKSGEQIMRHFKKGDTILVTGTPSSREWTDAQGMKHTVLETNIQRWCFTGAKKPDTPAATRTGELTYDYDQPF
jgi:single-strand DNA-binding protein